jgi:hypothetical protein
MADFERVRSQNRGVRDSYFLYFILYSCIILFVIIGLFDIFFYICCHRGNAAFESRLCLLGERGASWQGHFL